MAHFRHILPQKPAAVLPELHAPSSPDPSHLSLCLVSNSPLPPPPLPPASPPSPPSPSSPSSPSPPSPPSPLVSPSSPPRVHYQATDPMIYPSNINKKNFATSKIGILLTHIGFDFEVFPGSRGAFVTLRGYRAKCGRQKKGYHFQFELIRDKWYFKIHNERWSELTDEEWVEDTEHIKYEGWLKKYLPDKMKTSELRRELLAMKKKIEEHCGELE